MGKALFLSTKYSFLSNKTYTSLHDGCCYPLLIYSYGAAKGNHIGNVTPELDTFQIPQIFFHRIKPSATSLIPQHSL